MKDKELTIDSEVFEDLRFEFNHKMQTLIEGMMKRGVSEGKLTASIAISLDKEFVRKPGDPENVFNGIVFHPTFDTKVTTAISLKSSEKFQKEYEDHNLIKGADDRWCMRPADDYQMTLDDLEEE